MGRKVSRSKMRRRIMNKCRGRHRAGDMSFGVVKVRERESDVDSL